MADCENTGITRVTLSPDDCDICGECVDCSCGCPTWVKIATDVARCQSLAGSDFSEEAWAYSTVEEKVVQGELVNNGSWTSVQYGPVRWYRFDDVYIEVSGICHLDAPGITNNIMTGSYVNTTGSGTAYSIDPPFTLNEQLCCQWSCDPRWLFSSPDPNTFGGPFLIYQYGTKIYAPEHGVLPPTNPDCPCPLPNENYHCCYPAVVATFGGQYKLGKLFSRCRAAISARAQRGGSLGCEFIPIGSRLFPHFDPIEDRLPVGGVGAVFQLSMTLNCTGEFSTFVQQINPKGGIFPDFWSKGFVVPNGPHTGQVSMCIGVPFTTTMPIVRRITYTDGFGTFWTVEEDWGTIDVDVEWMP